ncbi:MAG TPA: carboxypeptidase-like regulatory domain-containing protein [Blastocatellia bacterium]|nr:carboxypeptidase-like regulatory domain-containing protein [Blastocatellia bacterium]
MSRGGAKKLFHLFIIFSILFCYTPVALPQGQTTGAIQGLVLDADNRQPISGAIITVTNEDTGLERTTVSGADGSYTISTLPPGFYTIKAAAPNYQSDSITRFPVRLSKVNTITPPPFALNKTGAAPQQTPATPTTPPPGDKTGEESQVEQLVNTVNATRSENFDSRQLVSLPLPSTRTFDDLAFLAPGVAPPPETIGTTVGPGIGPGVGTAGHFSINGLRSRSVNFTIDGSDNNDPDVGTRRQGFVTLIPQSIESIQEFQIATLLWDAEFGRTLGGQVNAVTKAGGNSFRGQAHGFFTHDDLNARNFFDYTGGPSGGENPFTRTQAGFVIGGPIVENRTQFFGSYEFLNINSSVEQHFATPAASERNALGLNLLNSVFTRQDGSLGILGFPGATPLGLNIFSFYPLPNNPSGPFGPNTYSEELPADGEGHIASFRVMQQVTQNNTLNARYNFTDDERVLPSVNQAVRSSIMSDSRTQNLSLILDSALSARLFNQARFSYGRTRLDFPEYPDDPLVYPERVLQAPILVDGVPFLVPSTTGGPIGQIVIQPFSPVGIDVFTFAQSRVNNTFQVADTLSFTMGRHSLKFGGDVRRFQLNSLQERNYRPQIVFGIGTFAVGDLLNDGNIDFDPRLFLSEGADLAAIGVPSSIFQSLTSGVPDSTIGLRFTEYNFFFNDNWQVRPNLTLDFGLRYEYNTVPIEVNDRIEDALSLNSLPMPGNSRFDTAQRTAAYNNAVNAYRQILDGRTKIYDKDANNFGPHLGLAWDPFGNGKTSIRAGYGIYYDTILGAVVSQSRNVFPTEIPLNIDPLFAGFSLFQLNNPALFFLDGDLNAPLIRPGTVNQFGLGGNDFAAAVGQLFLQGSSQGLAFTLPAKDLPTPYAQHWHLTLERELLNSYLVSAAYVGTKGTKLTRLTTPNLGPNVIPNGEFVVVPGLGVFLTDVDSFFAGRPNPNLGPFQIFENAASSNYHALQLEARKRYSAGYTFTAAYTWSHAIDEVSDVFPLAGAPVLPQDSSNPGLERGNASFDVRHRFATSLIWDLPFYRGQTGGVAGALGGWQIAGIFQYHSGQPFTLNVPFDANLDGNLTDRPSTTNGLVFLDEHGPQRVRIASGDSFLPFINVTGRFNEVTGLPELFPGTGFVGRNTVRADNFINLDVALSKDFRFTETQSLLFRTEVFNIFNRANFGIPVRVIGAPGFGSSINTVNPARIIQFALKYNF